MLALEAGSFRRVLNTSCRNVSDVLSFCEQKKKIIVMLAVLLSKSEIKVYGVSNFSVCKAKTLKSNLVLAVVLVIESNGL